MNYILNEQHGKKIAVILNGMGAPSFHFNAPANLKIQSSVTVRICQAMFEALSDHPSRGY